MTDITFTAPDGLSLYAKSHGPVDAPLTVLCMHGLTRNHKDFEPLIDTIGGNRRYISVDVRGRGRSAWAPDPASYTPLVYAKDMIALLDTLGIARVALVGTSMGGLMSMVMARLAGKRILGAALNDVGPVLEQAGLDRIAGYAGKVAPFASWDAAASAIAHTQSDVFPDYGPGDWMAFAKRTCRETSTGEVVFDYDPAITRTVSDVRPNWRTRFATWGLFAATKQFPLLVLRGATSDILSEKTVARMMRRHPDAQWVTVPRVGHAPILDEPVAAQAIDDFLTRLERAP
ncbi:MAG: alpha/beta hydrolase [Pseudomonadota bacterium]